MCTPCQARRQMAVDSANSFKQDTTVAAKLSTVVGAAVAISKHFIHNPPSFIGENMKDD